MIRLSQLTALEVSSVNISRDLDVNPKLHAYQSTVNGRTNTLLLQGDTSSMQQNTRKYAVSSFFGNTLLGTSNFYPEQGLGVSDYHVDSELHSLMNAVTLPTIEYKQAKLYFSQGLVGDSSIIGHHIKIFCKRSNDTEVILASIVDFSNDSNILANKSKLFESQIFNESLTFEFPDISYLLNSNVQEVINIRTLLFGNERPTEYFIEYSAFDEDSIDEFVENGYLFSRVSSKVINTQSMPVTFETSEMLAELKLSNNGYSISSSMIHKKYDIIQYLNTLKNDDESYEVTHSLSITSYNSDDEKISSSSIRLSDPTNNFNNIPYRPIVDSLTDHFIVDSDVKIENLQTGLIFRREGSLLITSADVHKFKAQATIEFSDITENIVKNVVNRQVNQIIQSSETPKILTIEKRSYVFTQSSNELVLFDSSFVAEINTLVDLTLHQEIYLKIGEELIKNETNQLKMFTIPKTAFSSTAKSYFILDSNLKIITTGLIVR